MGQPGMLKTCHRKEQTRRTETSKYPEEKKTISDSPSSGERTGTSLNPRSTDVGGFGAPLRVTNGFASRTNWKVRPKTVIARYAKVKSLKAFPE